VSSNLASALILANVRGGARNSRSRTSEALSARQAQALIGAAWLARRLGLPLNRHTTINLAQLGVPDDAAARAVTRITKLLREWLSKRGFATAFLWVRETGVAGHHLHLVWHLPPGMKLGRQTRVWAQLLSEGKVPAAAVLTRRIRGSGSPRSELYLKNLGGLISYLLKGCDTSTAAALNLPRCERAGLIIGKRSGTSNNLGPRARGALTGAL